MQLDTFRVQKRITQQQPRLRIFLQLIFLCLLFISVFPFLSNEPQIEEKTNLPIIIPESPKNSQLITGNNWFLSGYPGSGLESDPYLIKDRSFDGENAHDGIVIMNSSQHFVIENCTFLNIGGLSLASAAIKIVNSSNGIIRNNTFSTSFVGNYGIFLLNNSDFHLIEMNNISFFSIGIYLLYGLVYSGGCDNNTIIGNKLNNNTLQGIKSTGTVLYPNYFNSFCQNNLSSNTGEGLYLERTWYSTVSSNLIFNNTAYGVYSYYSDYSTIQYNVIMNNSHGIYAWQSDDNNVTQNVVVNNSQDGISYYANSDSGIIANNTMSFNKRHGLYINASSLFNVTRNYVTNNTGYGISLDYSGGTVYAHNNLIYKNYITNNTLGNAYDCQFNYNTGWNNWNCSSGGNWYGDYAGSDANGDGIGDTTLIITGSNSKAFDYLPVVGDPYYNGSGIAIGGAGRSWTYIGSRFWCDGNGTQDDPYIIKDLIINGQNETRGIYIYQSYSVYFQFVNCTVLNASTSTSYGVYFYHTNNGKIINSRICFNGIYGPGLSTGIGLSNCNDTTISGCHIWNNTNLGIVLSTARNLTLQGNLIENNSGSHGVSFGTVKNASVSNNIIRYNGYLAVSSAYGIYLSNTESCNFTENEFALNDLFNVYLFSYNYYNRFWQNNISKSLNSVNIISEASTFNINEWNTPSIGNIWYDYTGKDADDNGIGDAVYALYGVGSGADYKPICNDGFNSSSILIDDSSTNNWTWAKTRIWCNGLGTEVDPYYIKDLSIFAKAGNPGISIKNSNKFFILQNITVQNVTISGICAGIYLYNTTFGTIRQCNITNNNGIGIEMIYNSTHITVENTHLRNNTIAGILIGFNSNQSIIRNNQLYANGKCGICITNFTWNHQIMDNQIEKHTEYGIHLCNSSKANAIYHNNFTLIMTVGINIDGSSANNQIVNNRFESNLQHAIDNGVSNAWDDEASGNYWDDYSGYDTNGNGIGESFYSIDGSSNSKDRYPLCTTSDTTAPIVTIISPLPNALFGKTAPFYNITIQEYLLESQWYSLNGGTDRSFSKLTGIIDQGMWDILENGTVTIQFSGLDNASLIGSSQVTVFIDKLGPIIKLLNLIAGQEFGIDAPLIEFSVTDANLDKVWYNIDNRINMSFAEPTKISQLVWDSLPEGNVTLNIYATDTLGNFGAVSINIIKKAPIYTQLLFWEIIGAMSSVIFGAWGIIMKRRHDKVQEAKLVELDNRTKDINPDALKTPDIKNQVTESTNKMDKIAKSTKKS